MIILLKTYRFITHIFLRLLILGICLSLYDYFIEKIKYGLDGILLNVFLFYCFATTLYYFLKTKKIFHLKPNELTLDGKIRFKFDKIIGICNLINGLIITSFFILRLFKTDKSFSYPDSIIKVSLFLFLVFYGIIAIIYAIQTLKILFKANYHNNSTTNKISNSNKRRVSFKKRIKKFILIRLLIIVALLLVDLYIFRGLFSSKFYIPSDILNLKEIKSCSLLIQRKDKKNYVFSFKNNSLLPKYFTNYRNEEYFQKVTDTLFFNYSRNNIFPNIDYSYNYGFGCGTGLSLTSINPLESFHIEKSYKEIVNELSYAGAIKNTKFLYRNIKIDYGKLKHNQIDSIILSDSKLLSINDSIQIEYYLMMNSFLSKNDVFTKSNKINISLKDLLENYIKKNKLKTNTTN